MSRPSSFGFGALPITLPDAFNIGFLFAQEFLLIDPPLLGEDIRRNGVEHL